VLDNYATHKHPKVLAWLGRHPRRTERKTPRRMRWRVILEKTFSTALSHEAEVGVK
jgi:hypothetical protein